MGEKFSRRTFLKTGVKGLAAAGTAGILLNSKVAGASSMAMELNTNLNQYFKRFEVDKQLVSKVISEALSSGGDFCDVFFQHKLLNEIGLEDNIVHKA